MELHYFISRETHDYLQPCACCGYLSRGRVAVPVSSPDLAHGYNVVTVNVCGECYLSPDFETEHHDIGAPL